MVDQQGAYSLTHVLTWTFQGNLVEDIFEQAEEKHFVSDGQPDGGHKHMGWLNYIWLCNNIWCPTLQGEPFVKGDKRVSARRVAISTCLVWLRTKTAGNFLKPSQSHSTKLTKAWLLILKAWLLNLNPLTCQHNLQWENVVVYRSIGELKWGKRTRGLDFVFNPVGP